MRFRIGTLAAALLAMICACGVNKGLKQIESEYPLSFSLTVRNPAPFDRKDEIVSLSPADIPGAVTLFNPDAAVVLRRGRELASQAVDENGDGRTDRFLFLSDFDAGEARAFVIRYAADGVKRRPYPKRTQAELSRKTGGRFVKRVYEGGTFENVNFLAVPREHTDHSWFIRYEGPGWESDRVGYRFYLDWRNAIDMFGKKIPDMVLQDVGQDGFDSYHAMAGWGQDVLKVGESLGLGTLGMWVDGKAERVAVTDSVFCAITSNGPVSSSIRTRYSGWKIGGKKLNLTSDLSISAGERLTKHSINVDGHPPNLCTGIVRMDSTVVLNGPTEGGWSYLATWGKQSLAGDSLGLAVFFRNGDRIETAEDRHSHVVVLKPRDGELTYYLAGCWEQEPGGIRTLGAFKAWLGRTVERLDAPLQIAQPVE
ncbi:MAG: DUF4861 domain-containing protein [bacterium]|nr:DUF4861 domain-containing protein [bacterium]